MKRFFWLFILVNVFSCLKLTEFTHNYSIDRIFRDFSEKNSPGCAVAICKEGESIYKKGFGYADVENQIPITTETVFYAGSIGKQFTAFLILLLLENNEISLDESINHFLPDFPSYQHTITIRHLLNHTSGINDYGILWQLAGRHLIHQNQNNIYDLLKAQKSLCFKPGSQYVYTNSNYFLLGRIIEKATGKTIAEYAEEKIFNPLGMTSTRYISYQNLIPLRARGYGRDEKQQLIWHPNLQELTGQGGLYTSVDDLIKWNKNFINNQLGNKSRSLIDTFTISGHQYGPNAIYTFGIIRHKYRGLWIVSHEGGFPGFRGIFLEY